MLGFGPRRGIVIDSRMVLGKPAGEGESPVREIESRPSGIQSRTRHEEPCLNERGPPRKAKYYLVTDSAEVL